jgi:hypothetical protein
VFEDFFKNLNKGPIADEHTNQENHCLLENHEISDVDSPTNVPFTADEIRKVISRLKNNKACGLDSVTNEYIKSTVEVLLPVYVKLFNIILTTGVIPNEWSTGVIKPIYKNKGNKADPDNYRGITILSCLSKVFTALLNARLEKFVNDAKLIGPEQAGFRKGFSTMDHIFTLHGLIEMYLKKQKRIYGCFVDYQKAFDSVDRTTLWRKLLESGIKGKIFTVIYNLYKQAKSCVSLGGHLSSFFSCKTGVRQGENLSPLLFAIFLRDLEDFLSNYYCGLKDASKTISDVLGDEDIVNLIKLYILLYADDTILLAENSSELQKALDAMYSYCTKFKLKVNISKTKVVIFSRGKVRKYPNFTYGGQNLEVVDDYVYLGVTINYNGRFKKAMIKQQTQATRAMYALLNKARKLCLPVDIQLQLFDAVVKPILLYGSEVWGCQNVDIIERVHLKFLKIILNLNKSTATCMVYGELGCYPLRNCVNTRMISYWGRLLNGK